MLCEEDLSVYKLGYYKNNYCYAYIAIDVTAEPFTSHI